jgi:hypothetical protein
LLYTLADDGMTPIPCEDPVAWASWMETADRRVSQDYDEGDSGKRIHVSTVFLGTDMAYFGGSPLLWETMVFVDGDEWACERYASLAEAVAGHQEMCVRVREAFLGGT